MIRIALAALLIAGCGFDQGYDEASAPDEDQADRPGKSGQPTDDMSDDRPDRPTPPSCDPQREVNLLIDGDFDRRMGAWLDDSSLQVVTNFGPIAAQSPSYLAWLGGSSFSDERLTQTVVVPAGAHQLTVRAQFAVDEPSFPVDDSELEVLITDEGGRTLELLEEIESGDLDDSWALRAWHVSGDHAGRTIRLTFHVNTDVAPIGILIDSAELLARECDLTR